MGFAIIPVAVLLVLYYLTKNETLIATGGQDLEEQTAKKLRSLLNCHVFRNVLVPTSFGTTECDVVCATTRGVFIFECKYRSGNIIGNVREDNWHVTTKNNTFTMENPLKQNYYHVQAMSDFLAKQGVNTPVYSIPVILGEGSVNIVGEESIATPIFKSLTDFGKLKAYPEVVPPATANVAATLISAREGNRAELNAHASRVAARHAS